MRRFSPIFRYLAIGLAINIVITLLASQFAPLGNLELHANIRNVSIDKTSAKSFADLSHPPDGKTQEDLDWAREVEREALKTGTYWSVTSPLMYLSTCEMAVRSLATTYSFQMYDAHDAASDITFDARFGWRYEAGFPFRSFAATRLKTDSAWKGDLRTIQPLDQLPSQSLAVIYDNGQPSPDWDARPLPYLPMWPGLIANSVFYSLMVPMIWIFIRWRRIRRNLCGQCGYARVGLGNNAACPECGASAANRAL